MTFDDIDRVHQRISGTASKNFRNNREHFIEGEDYFCLEGPELKEFQRNFETENNSVSKRGGIRKLILLTALSPNGIIKPPRTLQNKILILSEKRYRRT